MNKAFESTGVPSRDMIMEKFPPVERIMRSRVAIAECYKCIPCNPCETSCPNKAITIGDDINNMPQIDFARCTGCGMCLTKCPGLAIMLAEGKQDGTIELSIPYEFSPAQKKGDAVAVLDREGAELCRSVVTDALCPRSFDRTQIVRFGIDKKYLYEARGIRLVKEG